VSPTSCVMSSAILVVIAIVLASVSDYTTDG
jgi:hypothetical protein